MFVWDESSIFQKHTTLLYREGGRMEPDQLLAPSSYMFQIRRWYKYTQTPYANHTKQDDRYAPLAAATSLRMYFLVFLSYIKLSWQ